MAWLTNFYCRSTVTAAEACGVAGFGQSSGPFCVCLEQHCVAVTWRAEESKLSVFLVQSRVQKIIVLEFSHGVVTGPSIMAVHFQNEMGKVIILG